MSERHVVSLGWNCVPSYWIAKERLNYWIAKERLNRNFMPFDNVLSPRLDLVAQLIANKFTGFFEDCQSQGSLRLVRHRAAQIRHNHKYDILFRYHDPISVDSHYDEFQKAIRRLTNLLESKEFVLFVRASDNTNRDRTQLDSAHAIIKKAYPNANFVISIADVAETSYASKDNADWQHYFNQLKTVYNLRSYEAES